MSQASKLALLKEVLESAESNLRSAKQILLDLTKGGGETSKYQKLTEALPEKTVGAEGAIIEGVFNGQSMIGSDKKTYPVPANYASKSKLIPGDILKLTIAPDGSFVYKQIGPIERRRVTGPLVYEDSQYRVLAEGKAYKVLLASVTYFRAEVGDAIVLIVPSYEDSEWGAIENVLPNEDAVASGDREDIDDFEDFESGTSEKKSSAKTKK